MIILKAVLSALLIILFGILLYIGIVNILVIIYRHMKK